MKHRTKYSILIISITGFILLVYNSVKWLYWELELLLISKILFAIGFISFALYFQAKDWRRILTKIMAVSFSLTLIIGVFLFYQHYALQQHYAILSEYEQIDTCDGLKERFKVDLENNELKYFDYGMFGNVELQKKLRKKYKIESFGMGCIVDMKESCYNKLVNEYLIEKYNDSIISDLY